MKNGVFKITDRKSGEQYLQESSPAEYEKYCARVKELEEENLSPGIAEVLQNRVLRESVEAAFRSSLREAVWIAEYEGEKELKKCFSTEKELRIGGVRWVGKGAFSCCPHVETLILEEGVEGTQEAILTACPALRRVQLPASLRFVGDSAFRDCENLEEVTFRNPYTWLTPDSFKGSRWLESHNEEFTVINGILLRYNGTDPKVYIPEGVREISHEVFSDCRTLEEVYCPRSLKNIWTYSFSDCKNLRRVYLNEGLRMICIAAFDGCTALTGLALPDSLEELGASALPAGAEVRYNGPHEGVRRYLEECSK